MKTARKPRVIQMNDDSVAFYRYCVTEKPTAEDFESMVHIFARANVDTLTHCVHCRWQAFYDSKVVEVAGDLTPPGVEPAEWTHYWQWMTCLRRLIAEGNDPPKVIGRACHRYGMNFLPSFRLNDQHGIHPHEEHYGTFRREHPEWIISTKAMDYGVPEVREHILKVVREVVARYDIDGLDLDFMRWPVYFKDEEVKANTPLMTEFIREIRQILEEAGKEKKRLLLLSARVPMKIGEGRVVNAHELTTSELECVGIGLDVRTWVEQGLIDMACPMNFFYTDWDTMRGNMDEWRALTDGTQCGLYPTIHGMALKGYGPPYISAESYGGAAHSFYLHGADGIALYNLWENNEVGWPAVRDMGDPIVLAAKPRRYHCHLGDLIPVARGERKTVEFYLPEDPGDPHVDATLRFTAVNLTLDHRLEVDVNGTPVDQKQLCFERRGPGRRQAYVDEGAPKLEYPHVVGFPLGGVALKGENVLGVRLVETNPEIPKKDTIEIGRVEALFEPR